MDISKEYIKMCEKAEEIQKEWMVLIGDHLSGGKGNNTGQIFDMESYIRNKNDDNRQYFYYG